MLTKRTRQWTDLEVAELGKMLPTTFKPTGKGLDLLVHNPMRSNISSLSKAFPTRLTRVRTFARMPAFMSLNYVNPLRNESWRHIKTLTLRLPNCENL